MEDKNAITLHGSRDKIDAIDTKIHNLLMDRALLVQNIQKAKEAQGPIVNAMHADRELEMFARFNKNHDGCLPIASLQRMFREMIATFSHLQCPFKVYVLKGEPLQRDVARYFYGTVIEVLECDNIEQMVKKILSPTSDIALLPSDGASLGVFNQILKATFGKSFEDKCHIFAHLPFWQDAESYGLDLPDMFVLGHAPMKITGNDFTMFSVKTSYKTANGLLRETDYLIDEYAENGENLFFTINQFISSDSEMMADIEKLFVESEISMACLGIYGKV